MCCLNLGLNGLEVCSSPFSIAPVFSTTLILIPPPSRASSWGYEGTNRAESNPPYLSSLSFSRSARFHSFGRLTGRIPFFFFLDDLHYFKRWAHNPDYCIFIINLSTWSGSFPLNVLTAMTSWVRTIIFDCVDTADFRCIYIYIYCLVKII